MLAALTADGVEVQKDKFSDEVQKDKFALIGSRTQVNRNPLVHMSEVYENSPIFIEDVYQIPVAAWPYDPLNRHWRPKKAG